MAKQASLWQGANLVSMAALLIASAPALPHRSPDPEALHARAHARDPDIAAVTLRAMDAFYPNEPFTASRPQAPTEGTPLGEVTYSFDGKTRTLQDLVERTYTNALLVIRDGRIVYETYRNGADANSRFQIMSISKSVNSLLLGQALADRRIASLSDPMSRYLPELIGSAYENVSIDDALQMRSGVVYDDNGEDADRFNKMTVRNETGGAVEFAKTLTARKPGRPYSYSTLEACLLGALVERASGRSLSRLTERQLWRPGGMSTPGFWQIEGATGHAVAGGGMNVSARDLGRIGEIVLNGGRYRGRRIMSEDWIARIDDGRDWALDPPGRLWHYRDQWWIDAASNAIVGRGYMGQLLFIDRPSRTVIVKFSYVPLSVPFLPIENEMMAAFRAVAASGHTNGL